MVRMDYQLALQYETHGQCDFLMNIAPARTRSQRVFNENLLVHGARHTTNHTDPVTANRMDRLQSNGGNVTLHYSCTVEFDHIIRNPEGIRELPVQSLPCEVISYLLPSRYCPADNMRQLATAMFGSMEPGYARVATICNWVTQHVRFSPGASNASTCAMQTFDMRAGVCRDYAHLMISMCRALNIPARYVTGVDYGADASYGAPDFHAYVEVFLGDRWYMFDPSGLAPVTGLLRIGTGRDAADVSFATLFGNVQCNRPTVSIQLVAHDGPQWVQAGDLSAAVSTAGASLYSPVEQSAPTMQTTPPMPLSNAWLVRVKPNPFHQPQFS
jgi:transglutaminase-like putative cysteine protease